MLNTERVDPRAKKHILNLTHQLGERGFEEIKATVPGYPNPTAFKNAATENRILPDVTAMRDGQKEIIEIAHKTDDPLALARKWHFLSRLAKIRNAIFKVVVPRGHMRFTRDLIARHDLRLEVEKL